jgi:hypothetical protein
LGGGDDGGWGDDYATEWEGWSSEGDRGEKKTSCKKGRVPVTSFTHTGCQRGTGSSRLKELRGCRSEKSLKWQPLKPLNIVYDILTTGPGSYDCLLIDIAWEARAMRKAAFPLACLAFSGCSRPVPIAMVCTRADVLTGTMQKDLGKEFAMSAEPFNVAN